MRPSWLALTAALLACISPAPCVSSDVAACEGTKAMHCTNVTFGCHALQTACEEVGSCFADNR